MDIVRLNLNDFLSENMDQARSILKKAHLTLDHNEF